ncbi:hypothetical protein TNCV_3684071 [Trichonephila clavipes]|nr:hypothetical protein TNCV_3684071 [Trichonephila clavipes]
MSRSPLTGCLFRRTTSERLDIAICGPASESYLLSLRSCTLPSYSQSVCDGNKASFSGLLIVVSLWRLIQLSMVKFAYSAFNTLSLKFSLENPARYSLPQHLQFLGYVSGFRCLTASGRHFRTTFLMLFKSSRCTLPRWWKSTPR